MTTTAVYLTAASVFVCAAVTLGVLLALTARGDWIRAEHARIRGRE